VSAIEPLRRCVNPAYGELQVGIYVAAIQDAMDRKQQLQPSLVSRGGALIGGSKGKNNNHGSGSGRKGGLGPRDKRKGGRGVAKGGRFQGSAADNNHGSGSGRKGGPGPRDKHKGGRGVAKGGRFQGSAAEKGATDDELAIEVRCSAQCGSFEA
jgi:hypothetical protein